jgi:tetratricopeptide (TPR) repeat protein
MSTFTVDFWLGGGSIVNFHITNILVHILCTIAVWLLAFQLFKLAEENSLFPYSGNRAHGPVQPICMAAWIAGLWALNPVQTSAVTYTVQRMATIQTLFYMVSVAFYIKGRRAHTAGPHSPWKYADYAVSALAALCAFFSKENSAALPAMLLFTEIWFFQPDLLRRAWGRFRGSRPLVSGAVVVVLAAALIIGANVFLKIIAAYDIRHFTLIERLLTESRVVLWYASLLLWPAPSRISLEYDVDVSTSLWQPPTTALSIAAIASLLWLVFRLRRSRPVFSYALLWFFVNMSVESTFVPLELIFVHRLYLPSVGLCICFALGATAIFRRYAPRGLTDRDRAALCRGACIILLCGLAFNTFSRNQVWRTQLSLYGDAAAKAPQNSRARINYASSLLSEGRLDEALVHAETALKLGRPKFESYSNAANTIVTILMQQGELEAAVQRGRHFLNNPPPYIKMNAFPALHLNLAQAHQALGQLDEAYSNTAAGLGLTLRMKPSLYVSTRLTAEKQLTEILEEAGQKNIDLTGAGMGEAARLPIKVAMARTYLSLGADADAERLLRQAASEDPRDNRAQDLLNELSKKRQLDRAQAANWDLAGKYGKGPFSAFNISMRLANSFSEKNKSSLLRGMGERCIDYALTIRPDSADAHIIKGWYHFGGDRAEEAAAEAQRALELEPGNSRSWLSLGFFLSKTNKRDEAAAAFQKVLDLYPGCPQRGAIEQTISRLRAKAGLQ